MIDDRAVEAAAMAIANDECIIGFVDPGKLSSNFTAREPIPNVTASLDAVIALVERELPGWIWSASDGDEHGPNAFVFRRGNKSPVGALAATPAIALCLALLRSKHHGGGNG